MVQGSWVGSPLLVLFFFFFSILFFIPYKLINCLGWDLRFTLCPSSLYTLLPFSSLSSLVLSSMFLFMVLVREDRTVASVSHRLINK